MVLIKCNVSFLKSDVDQVCCHYYDVISSVIPVQIEYFRIFKAAWITMLPLFDQEDSYDNLLKEGITYLSIMHNLYTHNQKEPSLYTFLLETLNLYTKLRLKLQGLLRVRQQLLDGHNVEYYSEKGLAILINVNNIDENHRFLNFKSEKEYEVEEHEVVDTFDLLTELHFCISLFKNVIIHIKMLTKMCTNPFLYSVLWEYRKKLGRSLRSNKAASKSCKLDRENNSSRSFCYLYNTLKEFVQCIDLMLKFYTRSITKLKYFTHVDILVLKKLMIIKSFI